MDKNTKRVVIVGSKPNADIPDGDALYCANGAIGYYAESVKRFRRTVSVLNPDLIHPKKRRDGASRKDFYQRQWEAIVNSRPDKMILTRTTSISLLTGILKEAGFSVPVSGISAYERRMLVGRISGCYDPILTGDFFRLPVDLKVRYAGSLASTYLKRIINKRKDCGSTFRPSTGVLSVVCAIDEYGHDAEYIISGIGVENRGDYCDGKNMRQRDLRPHVFADIKILRHLARRYSMYTTEPELMKIIVPLEGNGRFG